MLSEKIKLLFIQKGFILLTEEERQEYTNVLIDLNIPLDSIFAEFNLAYIAILNILLGFPIKMYFQISAHE